MKVRRSILLISFITSILSLIFILVLPESTKSFQIALALMGSSFISFMLEVPNYLSLKHQNSAGLYYSLSDLKMQINTFINITEDYIENNHIVTDKYYEYLLNLITASTNNIRNFDSNYYISKRKRERLLKAFSNLNSALFNLKSVTSNYNINYYKTQINIINTEKIDRNLTAKDIIKNLQLIIDTSKVFLEIIEDNIEFVLPKNKQKDWKSDNGIVINNNVSFKISKKDKE